jgi:hypothetical protein
MSDETKPAEPENARWKRAELEELIDGESLIDTLIECSPISKTLAYEGLRAALNQLQRELETDGVKGKWRTWPDDKEAA